MKTALKMTAIIGLAGLCAAAQAQSLISTMSSTYGNVWGVGTFQIIEGFTTGSAAESVGGAAFVPNTTTSSASQLTLGIYSDVSGAPGSLIANGSLSGPSSFTSGTAATYTTSGLTLAASTTYFLVFNDTVGNISIENRQGGSLVTTSSAGWTLGQLGYRSEGSSGSYNFGYTGIGEPLFAILTPTPEPGTWALTGVGASLLFFFRKR